MHELTLTQPDDWHLHLRDGVELKSVAHFSANQMARAIIMPNLKEPITTVAMAKKYKGHILAALDKKTNFKPLMTLYLTDNIELKEIEKSKNSNIVYAFKLYPQGATTNSAKGVSNIKNIYPIFEKIADMDMPLLVHGEVVDDNVDIFDREKVFIDKVLIPIIKAFPELKIVFEHITTKDAVDFVLESDKNIGATITAHHLIYNRNDMLTGGIYPHNYCLPILKRKAPHQKALIDAAISGNPKFFLGTDSAPHSINNKETNCGCAGVFSSFAAIELYTSVFDKYQALDKLEAFASFYGADFYGLRRNKKTIVLKKEAWQIPQSYPFAATKVVPFMAGKSLNWKIK